MLLFFYILLYNKINNTKGELNMLKSKYITKDDFKEYWGIDLEVELKTNDNPSDEVDAFLFRIETRIATHLDAKFYRNVDMEYPKFSDYQKEHYKFALLEQAYYVLTQGDLSTDSGFDINEGEKIDRSKIKSIYFSENAIEHLILCGLWCRKIRNRSRGGLNGWYY